MKSLNELFINSNLEKLKQYLNFKYPYTEKPETIDKMFFFLQQTVNLLLEEHKMYERDCVLCFLKRKMDND